jgi:hypothetical protein
MIFHAEVDVQQQQIVEEVTEIPQIWRGDVGDSRRGDLQI